MEVEQTNQVIKTKLSSGNYSLYSLVLVLHLLTTGLAQGQTEESPSFQWSGYLEAYYCYDVGNPLDHRRPSFTYAYDRHNEVNLNLGFIKAAYQKSSVRANLAFMTGTYANANLAAEPGVLRNILEGNVGVKISKHHNLWVDAGIFASHIGFESAVGKDCWTLTRSILADNSPYFESGVKLSYTTPNEKWFVSGLLLNGWQRIQRLSGNSLPAFGHQLTYKPSSKLTFNSSSFVGSDTPDSTRLMRCFHNFYAQYQCSKQFGLILGFDAGMQQKAKSSATYDYWYSPVVMAKYSIGSKSSCTARLEYYADANGVIIVPTDGTSGFQTFGYSLNFDYLILDNVLWRIEGKGFKAKEAVFQRLGKATDANYSFCTSLAVSF